MIRMGLQGLEGLTEGLKDLEKELVALGANEGRRVLTRGARKAFAPVLEAAQQNAEAISDTGLTRDNIVIATQKPKDGESVVNVGLRVRKSKGTRLRKDGRKATSPHWRWHFIEGGTSTQAARPFLRPALDANAEKVVGNLRGELRKAIDRVLKKRKRDGVAGAAKRQLKGAGTFAKAGWKGFKRGLR